MPVEIVEFRPFVKNTLQGFATVLLPSGMEIRDLTVHQKNGQRWIGFPARAYKKENGTEAWVPYIRIPDRERRDEFQKAVLAALDGYQPPREEPANDEQEIPF